MPLWERMPVQFIIKGRKLLEVARWAKRVLKMQVNATHVDVIRTELEKNY